MSTSLDYARWFRDSTPYIKAHRDRTFVILLGSDAIGHDNLTNIVHDLALCSVLGIRVVLVHGARDQIDDALTVTGRHTRFHGNRRVTDRETLTEVIAAAAANRERLEGLFSMGLPSTPLHNADIQVLSGNFVTARPLGVIDGIDHQFTGKPRRINTTRLRRLLADDTILLLSPLGYSPSGEVFNLSAEELAADVAIALGADKLVMFAPTGTLGDAPGALTPARLEPLVDTLDDATLRYRLAELLRACRAGVPRGHLVSYADDGALLGELFTARGSGTQVSEALAEGIRPATPADVADIVELIRPLEDAGVLVRRSRDRLEREVDRFFVAEVDGILAGCCALYRYGAARAAELACLATHPGHRKLDGQRARVGDALLAHVEHAARSMGLEALFVLTTQTRDYFTERGFAPAEPTELPAEKRELYNFQRNSKVLMKRL